MVDILRSLGGSSARIRKITPRGVVLLVLAFLCFCIILGGIHDLILSLILCGIVIMGGSVFFARTYIKYEELAFNIEKLPELETNEAVEGIPFTGYGVVEADELLTSPYTNTPCVYYHSIEEKLVRHGRSEVWKVISNVAKYVPFYIRDKRGRLKVDLRNMDEDFSGYRIEPSHPHLPNPSNSEIDCDAVIYKKVEKRKVWELGPLQLFDYYRKSEFVLSPGTEVFVCGMVERDASGELVIREHKDIPLIITKKTKEEYLEEFYRGKDLVYLWHFLAAIGYSVFMISISSLIPPDIFPILFFAGNGIIIGSVFFSMYNRIITLLNRAEYALYNIDVELKRREDLIPAIVEIVKGYAKYEAEVNKILAEARAAIVFTREKFAREIEEDPQIKSLVSIIEKYPTIRANENFESLMKELIDAEERIAYSRKFYNNSVMKYNTLIKEFPFVIISRLLGFKEKEYITIARGEEAAKSSRNLAKFPAR